MTPIFIGSEIYRGSSYGAWHPLHIPRVSTVMDLSRALGWLPPSQYRTSPRAKPRALTLFHTPDYIAALQQAEATQRVDDDTRARHGLGSTANPVFPEMYRRPATGAGGVMLAAELVRDGGIVHVPGGGTHHAMASYANGFCYLNDPVLCLLSLRQLGLARIAYVDIDAHHCDGVEAALTGASDMLMISVHEERRWPFTGALDDDGGGRALNLPVPRGLNDTEMRTILQRLILPALERFDPDAIVLQCGSDAIEEDPLSRLSLSNNAHAEVAVALTALAPRLIVLGGGGYNPWSVARCWTRVWGALNGWAVQGHIPEGAAQVLEGLRWNRRAAGRNPPEAWRSTLIDPPHEGPVRTEITDRIDHLRRRLPRARQLRETAS
ncbi:acetoin utilization protein AcuC [Roseinatronobacter bogoriensis]|uniref:Acetoin utilization protein AcuC n=1 Tax=Roseinatronobacter bogoriensis subsp. barguzinensis TaxID=441209 RepID=A0A2K8K964_9RHOB|nr:MULTISPECIES: acetoin utilization protein AcuC [Rhodobaca]ATX65476.1 acetoin utilization protein AcuC [Rhodobaca barguzinensis]MBB4209066.1 acetoin utilization protein AcuC [Rhodobaca bogoriensis DSM 18756]TDW37508.1 acetoin utilization protein AcuC [Rhodobaca barguzinensis]TDY68119.1 acetoin utilization protein AcuC [Rhodobaca bogoriensis DSM 18756]